MKTNSKYPVAILDSTSMSQQEIDKMANQIKGLEGQDFLHEVDLIIDSCGLNEHKGGYYIVLLSEINIAKNHLNITNRTIRHTRLIAYLLWFMTKTRLNEHGKMVAPKFSKDFSLRVEKRLNKKASPDVIHMYANILNELELTEFQDFLNVFQLNDHEAVCQMKNPKYRDNKYLLNKVAAHDVMSKIAHSIGEHDKLVEMCLQACREWGLHTD